jgi:hypothetical protein
LHFKRAKWNRLTRHNQWNLNEMDIFHWLRILRLWSSRINHVCWPAHCQIKSIWFFLVQRHLWTLRFSIKNCPLSMKEASV